MGVIITPPGGGANYPNISDVSNVVTINPSVAVAITSDIITIESNTLNFQSPSSGTLTYNDFENVNFNNTNLNINSDNAYIVSEGGKVGFFSDTNSSVQANAIANPTPLTIYDRVGDILDALRAYGLIKT